MWCIGIIASFCFVEQTPPPPPVDSFCVLYRPVFLSHKDTRGTKEQVDKNNAMFKACPK